MRTVIQRVKRASVKVNNKTISQINRGLLIFLGIGDDDEAEIKNQPINWQIKIKKLVNKIINLRVFENEEKKFDQSLLNIKGEALVVPQFTLYADCSKGKRPYFGQAAKPKIAKSLFEKFIDILKSENVKVEKGQFGAKMEVSLVNDGPVTIILDSRTIK